MARANDMIYQNRGQGPDEALMAEYMILRSLETAGSSLSFDELQKEVYGLSRKVKKLGQTVPLHFHSQNGIDSLKSDTFVSALSRCRSARSVYKQDNKFYLSEGGESFISNIDKYDVPSSYVNAIDEAITDDETVEIVSD